MQNDGFCIKNDGFCTKTDEIWKAAERYEQAAELNKQIQTLTAEMVSRHDETAATTKRPPRNDDQEILRQLAQDTAGTPEFCIENDGF